MLRHLFVSTASDGPDASKLRPSNWNAEHVFTGGVDGNILVRDSVVPEGASWKGVLQLSFGGATLTPQVAGDVVSINVGTLSGTGNPRGINMFGTVVPGAGSAFRIRVSSTDSVTTNLLSSGLAVTIDAGYISAIGRSHAGRFVCGATTPSNNFWNVGTNGGNVGVYSACQGAAPNVNCGLFSEAQAATQMNIGLAARSVSPVNAATIGIGIYGSSQDASGLGSIRIAGLFRLDSGLGINPNTEAVSAALIADNSTSAAQIFIARANGIPVFTIGVTGDISAANILAGNVVLGDATHTKTLTVGRGDASAVVDLAVIKATDGVGANVGGNSLVLTGGASTGAASGGAVIFKTNLNGGASSSVLNTPTERGRYSGSGVGGLSINYSGGGQDHYLTVNQPIASVNADAQITPSADGRIGLAIQDRTTQTAAALRVFKAGSASIDWLSIGGTGVNRFNGGYFEFGDAQAGGGQVVIGVAGIAGQDGVLKLVEGTTNNAYRMVAAQADGKFKIKDPSQTDRFVMASGGDIIMSGNVAVKSVLSTPVTYANRPATPAIGMQVTITDSSTAVWGATIAGGGGNTVLAFYDGANWTVAGK